MRAALATAAAVLASMPLATRHARAKTDAATLSPGAYVAVLGDCAACHTARGGAALAGGLPIHTPLGTMYSTNITPDHRTGIGDWSEADFVRLMRHGVRKDGATVYPSMPYPSYARMSDADLHALYVWLRTGVTPVAQEDRPSDISWPFSMRWPLQLWRAAFVPDIRPAGDEQPDPVARGKYIVEGPGHCGACHTQRSWSLAERALRSEDGGDFLAGGGAIDGWIAPSLRDGGPASLAGWSEDDLVAFLRTGRNDHGATLGAMNDVIVHSTSRMTDRDLHSIARYLKTLRSDDIADYRYDPTVSNALYRGDLASEGARIYVDRCAACHRTDGRGYPGVFPPLAGNPLLQSGNALSAIHIVMDGGRLPALGTAPSSFVMAGGRDVLDDRQIAAVVTFIQRSWGNHGAPATQREVKALRREAPSDLSVLAPTISPEAKHAD